MDGITVTPLPPLSTDMYHVSRMLTAYLVYVLVLIRCGAVILFAPFLSSEVFSTRIRLSFALVFPLLVLPVAARTADVPYAMDMVHFFILAGQEFALGMTIAFLGKLIFEGVQIAGQIAGQQIGFSMSSVMDPSSGEEQPMLSFLNYNLTMMMFVISKLHLVVLWIMFKSYEYVGIGTMNPRVNYNNPALLLSLDQLADMFRLGVRMAMPVMLVMLMNSIVEGFITKTMPQMNIQVFGMPLRVTVGLCSMIFIYPALCMSLLPADWQFNLRDMPEGPIGDMLVSLSEMVRMMGSPAAAAGY